MISAEILDIEQHDHSKLMFIIEPVLERFGDGISATGSYKIYRSYIYNQPGQFNETQPIKYKIDDLPDEENPDYLGNFSIEATGAWHYHGGHLNAEEQQQLAHQVKEFISS